MTDIDMQPVDSSTISAIGYDPEQNTLTVEFKSGGTYTYTNVSKSVYDELIGAKSIGTHFAKHIKGAYDFSKQ